MVVEDLEELFTQNINTLPVNHPRIVEDALNVQIEDRTTLVKGLNEAGGFDLYMAEDMLILAGQ